MNVEEKAIQANGLNFAYLEAGDGPLVMLFHGFPDNAWGWEFQLEALAEAGYRVVAPFMRGYFPTEIPADGKYDLTTLGHDVVELARTLNDGQPCFAVGHDIGALGLQAAVAEDEALFPRPVFVSVNHSATAPGIGLTPRLAHRSFHLWLLGYDSINEIVASHENMALVDYLWKLWSPDDVDYTGQLARVKETFSHEGSLKAAVSVYPNLVPGENTGVTEAMLQPVNVPVLLIYGSDDALPPALTEGEEQYHLAGFRREVIDGGVHWPHRERPDEVNRLLIDWLGSDEPPVARDATAAAAG